MLQGAKPLFALLDGNAEIVVGMENERGSVDVAGVFQRRGVPVSVEIFEQDAFEIFFVTVSAVSRSFIAEKVGDRAQGARCLEAIGVGDNPVGHVAAVTSAGDA